MKWDCGLTREEEYERLCGWHPYFALIPRQVASHDCRWLEWIERKGQFLGIYGGWEWEYRARGLE